MISSSTSKNVTPFLNPPPSSSETSSVRLSFDAALEFVQKGYRQIAQAVSWMIENRGGLAKIAGLAILPAQYTSLDKTTSNKIVDGCLKHGLLNGTLEKIKIPMGNSSIEGIICYPKNWKKEDRSQCILYHNPNGVAIGEFLEEDYLGWTPGTFFQVKERPIILYDYRGVGLNRDEAPNKLHATYESIVKDGEAALKYALTTFDEVEVIGSSLGGGVATASLDRHLANNPSDLNRITRLINHDSFTTTPRVVFPKMSRIADFLGSIVGANLDAMTPMKKLIDRGVKVQVLYHTKDPVIPFGARMGDLVQTLPKSSNLTVCASPRYGHANLSSEMIDFL